MNCKPGAYAVKASGDCSLAAPSWTAADFLCKTGINNFLLERFLAQYDGAKVKILKGMNVSRLLDKLQQNGASSFEAQLVKDALLEEK